MNSYRTFAPSAINSQKKKLAHNSSKVVQLLSYTAFLHHLTIDNTA
jgi:hypothetical protein